MSYGELLPREVEPPPPWRRWASLAIVSGVLLWAGWALGDFAYTTGHDHGIVAASPGGSAFLWVLAGMVVPMPRVYLLRLRPAGRSLLLKLYGIAWLAIAVGGFVATVMF